MDKDSRHDGDGESFRRRRTCGECGKPLGSTLGYCYECGGEQRSLSREERLANARTWKILLGVDPELIEEAHSKE